MIRIRNVSEFLKEYRFGETIGKSKLSTIKEVTNLQTGTVYVAKIIEKKKTKNVYDEFNILTKIQDIENVIKIYDAFEDELYFLMILQRLKQPDIAEYLNKKGPLTVINAKKIIYILAITLQKLHKKGIVHVDIKPDNIMCDHKGQIILFDFGLARLQDDLKKCCSGTIYYISPEIIINIRSDYKYNIISNKIDIWALGITMYTLLLKEYPFYSDNISNVPDIILNRNINENALFKLLDNSAQDLIIKCLNKNPLDRITIQEITNHPWFFDL